MRLVIAGLALVMAVPALAGVPGLSMVAAQSPVSTQPLAPGEVLLEVNALGTVTTRADSATLHVPIDASGATEVEARRAAEGNADRIVAAAASAHVAASDINRRPVTVGQGAAMAMAMQEMRRATEAAQQSASGHRPAVLIPSPSTASAAASAHAEVEIKVRGLDRLPELQRALEAAGVNDMPDPTYALTDDRASRADARAQAIAQARANADAYAAALGMRVLRIVRVTERVGMDLIGTMFSEGARMRQMMSGMEGRNQDISTTVALGMDFALAPR
jgi:uncharacterized protein YggE